MGAEIQVAQPALNSEVARFLPVMEMAHAQTRYQAMVAFARDILRDGVDYGKVPGSERACLLKAGAEKMNVFMGFTSKFITVEKNETWDGEEPFFYYWFKCQLSRGDYLIAEGDGSCNSHESKYRYRWVADDQIPPHLERQRLLKRAGRISEFEFAIEKAETTGKYGKPAAYWQAFKEAIETGKAVRVQKKTSRGMSTAWEIDSTVYRVPNPDVADQTNTILKMAQKRALVAATLIACSASEFFTQDLDDLETVDVTAETPPSQPAPEPPLQTSGVRPMTLDQILANFTDARGNANPEVIAEAFRQMREHFLQFYPQETYDKIIAEHAGKAKRAFTALWNMYQQAMRERADEAREEPPQ